VVKDEREVAVVIRPYWLRGEIVREGGGCSPPRDGPCYCCERLERRERSRPS
jgi:hypothetical protein